MKKTFTKESIVLHEGVTIENNQVISVVWK